MIAIIAAKERWRVTVIDVPGSYLPTDLRGGEVLVKFEGRMAELLEMIDPKMYCKHIVVKKGKKVLYEELA